MSKLYSTSLILLIIGGINWGLIGIVNFDIISFIFGPIIILTKLTYLLIGAASVFVLFNFKKIK